jgi:hypothetical protein
MPKVEIAHCFVSREDWPEWCRVNPDIAGDYDVFLKGLAKFCQDIEAEGGIVVKVNVQPSEFVAWCAHRGRNIDSKSRAAYAAFRMVKSKSGD